VSVTVTVSVGKTRNLERVRVRDSKKSDVRIRFRCAIRKFRDVRIRIRFAICKIPDVRSAIRRSQDVKFIDEIK
jgi:hypothetical protein